MTKKLVVSPSPHIKAEASTSSLMLSVTAALIPALVASVVIFGVGSLVLVAVSVVACVLFEYLFNMITKRPQTITDCSAVVTGILLAFNVPPTLPVWMIVIGAFVSIFIAKQLFGGIGQNFANPAILGRIVLMVSFSGPMTNWLIPSFQNGAIDVTTGATPLALMAEGKLTQVPDPIMMLLGLRGGCLGETCAVALIIGGIFLIWKKVITWTTPVCFLGTVMVFAALAGQNPLAHLLSGGAILGAFFMATDYATSPVTERGKAIFAVGCGLITVLIRVYGSYPEGVSFAILIMNILTPHIDSLTRTKPVGGAM